MTDDFRRLVWVRDQCRTGRARRIREGAGLSLRETAAAIPGGVSPTSVLRWENGDVRPTGERALAYAVLLEQLGKCAGGPVGMRR